MQMRKENELQIFQWNKCHLAFGICCIDHFALFLLLTVRRESNSGVYFAGMFRVANVEFIPEYRHADSSEFVSMANQIQHVVSESSFHTL